LVGLLVGMRELFELLMLVLIKLFSAHGRPKTSYLHRGARTILCEGLGLFSPLDRFCPAWTDFVHGQAHGPFAINMLFCCTSIILAYVKLIQHTRIKKSASM
jgi:hypothetical protein